MGILQYLLCGMFVLSVGDLLLDAKVTDLYATIEDRIEDRTSGPIDPNRAINIEHFIEEPQR